MCREAGSFTTILFALFFTGVARGDKCGHDEMMRCSSPLPGLSSAADLSIALNREELNNSCVELQAGIRCISNYTEHCMSLVERQKFNRMYEGVNSVMRSLCQPGRYQDDYLRHAACIKRVKPEYEMCSKNYELTLTTVSAQGGEHHAGRDAEYLRTVCCSFQEYLLCLEQTVQRTCGDEAAVFTSVFLKRMAGIIIKSYCLEYRGEECGMANSAHRAGPSWLFLTAIACAVSALARLPGGAGAADPARHAATSPLV